MQNYLKLENMNTNEAQTLFKYRTRMAKFGENYRGSKLSILCPLCMTHLDSQKMAIENCPVVKKSISISGDYNQIFNTSLIPSDIVQTIVKLDKFREEYSTKMSHDEANSTRQHASWMGAPDNHADCQDS